MGSDWRDQISSIIADTNRNLGGRALATVVPPLTYRPTRPATYDSVFSGAGSSACASTGGVFSGVGGIKMPSSPPRSAAATSDAAYQAQEAQQQPLDALMVEQARNSQTGNFQSSLQRIVESVKFELDVRGSIAQKHMEAVREEMAAGMQEAERRCLDIAKQVDAAVGVRLETEKQLREGMEKTVGRLQDGMSESHKETVRVVSEFQSTSIDHAEVLRRLEQARGGRPSHTWPAAAAAALRPCAPPTLPHELRPSPLVGSRSCSPSSSTPRPR